MTGDEAGPGGRPTPAGWSGGALRVAVTGAGGRLASALVRLLHEAPFTAEVLGWDLPEHDLDDPASAGRLVAEHRPEVVIHCAAWTDVDGCAREPELAMRRNGAATGELAEACVAAGASMVLVSTNEVFDGLRTDGRGYSPLDAPAPGNAYGAAKLEGELRARAAFGVSGFEFARAAIVGAGRGIADVGPVGRAAEARRPAPRLPAPQLAIVRTAWLFGLPGSDFPQKILAAARRAMTEGAELSLVADETGNPTFAPDLAAAIVGLVAESYGPFGRTFEGIHHVVNGGTASRAEWAREVLRLARLNVPTRTVSAGDWPRPSRPPTWGVLESTPRRGPLRPWQDALAGYVRQLEHAAEAPR